MRASSLIVLFLFASAVVAAVPGIAAAAESTPGFVAWALDRAGEMDLRWNRMTGLGEAKCPEARATTCPSTDFSSASARTVHGMKLSHDIVTSNSYLHKVTTKNQLLPLSTRERNGAARGVSRLESPAKAHLSTSYSVKRPLNSSIQQKHFVRSFGSSVSRPKLDSFGRINKTGHTRSRGFSHPAGRWDRPRIL